MRKLFIMALSALTTMFTAGSAFAAEAASDAASAGMDASTGLVYACAALGMGLAAFGCGIGQGLGLKGACDGTARNPEASNKITVTLILGLAFIESLAIYALVVNLILLFVK